jgi:hypothetical protein
MEMTMVCKLKSYCIAVRCLYYLVSANMTENIPKKAGGNQDFRRQAHSYCMVTAQAASDRVSLRNPLRRSNSRPMTCRL